jgi:hypothetical protein
MKIVHSNHIKLIYNYDYRLPLVAAGERIFVIAPSSRAIVALTKDGQLDKSFDTDAIGYFAEDAITPFWLRSAGGKLEVQGVALPWDGQASRIETITLLATGIPSLPAPSGITSIDGRGVSMAVSDSAGSLYLASAIWADLRNVSHVEKLLPGGAKDPVFGANSFKALPREFTIKDLAIADDGSVYVAGQLFVAPDPATNTPGYVTGSVFKLRPSGEVDSLFGKNGSITLADKQSVFEVQLAVDKRGDLTVGYVLDNSAASILTRVHADGSTDTNFGDKGSALLKMAPGGGMTIPLVTDLLTDGDLVFAVVSHRYGQKLTLIPVTEKGFDAHAFDINLVGMGSSATGLIDTVSRHITLANQFSMSPDIDIATVSYADLFQFARAGESFYGSFGDDTMLGSAAANTFAASRGRDKIDGLGGQDWLVYQGPSAQFTVATRAGGGFTVTDATRREGVSDIVNIERLKFADKAVALDLDGVAGQAYRIYSAAFDRTPDLGGLGYWIKAMDAGMTLEAVAQGFVDSEEFRAAYGATPSNTALVTKFYQNVLGRAPDPGGIAFWVDLLDRKIIGVAAALAAFSESPENLNVVAELIGNGIEYVPYG